MNLPANAALSLKGRRGLCLAVVERERTLPQAAEPTPDQRQAERFIRTLLCGWAHDAIYRSSTERTAALDGWLYHFRGRDGRCWPPPAQIPACASNALGS